MVHVAPHEGHTVRGNMAINMERAHRLTESGGYKRVKKMNAFSGRMGQIMGDAINIATAYGRIEAKHYNNISKMLNAFGNEGEYGISWVSIEFLLDELAKAIDEGRLEVRNGKSKIQSVQKNKSK